MPRSAPIFALLCKRFCFLAHLILLALASTNYMLPAMIGLGGGSWNFHFDFLTISKRYVWGTEYVSKFSLGVVLGYLAAYLLGTIYYGWELKSTPRSNNWRNVLWVGLILSALGAATFGFEATHWIWPHGRSYLFSLPPVVLILGIMNLRVGLKRPTIS